MQISKIKKIHFLAPLIVAVLIGVFWVSVSNRSTEAVTNPPCPSTYYFDLDTSTGTSIPSPVSGLHTLNLRTTTSTINASRVDFMIDNAILGRGQPGASGSWSTQWYSQMNTYGGHQISANIYSSTGTCSAPVFPVTTSNSANTFVPQISARVTTPVLSVPTGGGIDISLATTIPAYPLSGLPAAADVTPSTVFVKNASGNFGIISTPPTDTSNVFRYTAGTKGGVDNVVVNAYYGGATAIVQIPITILATTAPVPVATTGTSTTSASGTTSTTNATTDPNAPKAAGTNTAAPITSATSIEADPVAKSCVTGGLTPERYKEISSGASRPTAAEFESINKCFAPRNYVLPTGFVPIAPEKVSQLPQATEVKIDGASNGSKKLGDTSLTTLTFQGKAAPDSLVILYVHSDPLVISTKADKNGDWSYSLQDPLESGKHEVYAVVDKGNGSYQRSSLFSFVIAKASANAANPKGYNLKLASIKPTATENNRPMNIYISAMVALIVLVLGTLFISLRIRNRRHAASGATTATTGADGMSTSDAGSSFVETHQTPVDPNTIDATYTPPPTTMPTAPPEEMVDETNPAPEPSVISNTPPEPAQPIVSSDSNPEERHDA